MKEKLYESFSLFLFVIIIVLSIKIFNTSYVIDINKINLGYIYLNTFNINNLFKIKSKSNNVNNDIIFKECKENEYITNSSYIPCINDGVVYVANINQIIINQNDGYLLFINGFFEPLINKGDYVERNVTIALYIDTFEIYFTKGNIKYDYQEYIKNSI